MKRGRKMTAFSSVKRIVILLIVVLMLFFLAGCSETESKAQVDETPQQTIDPEEAAKEEERAQRKAEEDRINQYLTDNLPGTLSYLLVEKDKFPILATLLGNTLIVQYRVRYSFLIPYVVELTYDTTIGVSEAYNHPITMYSVYYKSDEVESAKTEWKRDTGKTGSFIASNDVWLPSGTNKSKDYCSVKDMYSFYGIDQAWIEDEFMPQIGVSGKTIQENSIKPTPSPTPTPKPTLEPLPDDTTPVSFYVYVGQIVYFKGGPVYAGPYSDNPYTNMKEGLAIIDEINDGTNTKHPYHLIGGKFDDKVGGESDVHGWVSSGMISLP